jgi:glycogen(starch) synthase
MNIILVASWYPAVDDPARGRFVADQAAALLRTGEACPTAVSFDPLAATSDLAVRKKDLGAGTRLAHQAWRRDAGSPFSPRGFGSFDDVPVARLPIADGPALGPGQDAEQRRLALDLLADTLPSGLATAPGVVHAHTAYPDGYAAARLAARLGWPLVITEHASFVGRQLREPAVRRRYFAAVEAAARFIAVSETLAGELMAAIPALAGRVDVIPNLVHLDDFLLQPARTRRPGELLFVGYRKATKGMPILFEAFAEIHRARPETTLRLVGRSSTPADEARWVALTEQLGIREAVALDPPADRAGVAEALARASLFVHPSPRETFGITTLEALASGLPVVAARSGGVSGILEDPELGELVPANDAGALAAAVIGALDRRSSFVPERLRDSVRPYADDAVAERLTALYREVVGKRDGQSPSRASVLVASPKAAALPERLLAVSSGEATDGPAWPAALRRRIETVRVPGVAATRPGRTMPGGRYGRRLRQLLAAPLQAIRQVWARNPISQRRWRTAREAATRALDEALAEGPVDVLSLDAYGAWAVELAAREGRARPLAGGALWAADRWWSAQEPVSASRDRISSANRPPTTGQS